MATQLQERSPDTNRTAAHTGNGPRAVGAPARAPHHYRCPYNPQGEVRVARLRLAWTLLSAGATHQAQGAYADMVRDYRGTPTALAVAADLLEMASLLQRRGMVYSALDTIRKVGEAE